MSIIRSLPVCLSLAFALGATVSLPAQAQDAADRDAAFAAATQEYRAQHYAGAYGRFVRLADQGHAEAARIAWMMYRD
jgi:hypothetical protein